MTSRYQIILCTCPNIESAEKLACLLVESKLAACVNIVPGLISIYSWQGQIERADEHLLIIKARKEAYAAIEAALKAHHPYQVPEIIAIPIERGLPDYLHWIDTCRFSN